MIKFKPPKNPTHYSYNFYDKNKLNNKIYNNLCIESRKIYNLSIFCIDIFNLYKLDIYKSIYKNKKIKNCEYDDIIINKLMNYFDEYVQIKDKLKNNNNYIYKYIISYVNDNKIILKKSNFYDIEKKIRYDLFNNNNIIMSNNKILFDNIIYRILFSIYNKNFNLIKNQMLNHEPLSFNDIELNTEIKTKNILEQQVCKNYKMDFMELKTDENYISRFVYKKLGDNTLNLQSTLITSIIKKAYDAYSSFYALKKLGFNKANKPKYLEKNKLYNLIYYYSDVVIDNVNKQLKLFSSNRISKNFNKIIDNNYIELDNNKYICKKYMKKIKIIKKKVKNKIIKKKEKKKKKDNYIIDNYYIEKTNRNIIDSRYIIIPIPEKIQNKKIKSIEIIPIYNTYKIVYNYINENIKTEEIQNIKVEETISIDLGITNFLTIYNPTGNQHIIKGGVLKSLNYYITKKIGDNQSKNNLINIQKLIKKREDKINDFYNRIITWLKKEYSTKKLIIIGYNELWKQNSNLGKKSNMIFNKIPYLKLINKLKLHFNVITTEESYTSKCDSLNLEKIEKKEIYNGARIKRGLFSSAKNKLLNADINGAINIMRKQINLINILGENLFNPKVINVFKKVTNINHDV